MALSNAEKQAAWRARHKQELAELRANAAPAEEKQQSQTFPAVSLLPPPSGIAERLKTALVLVPKNREAFKRDLIARVRQLRETAGLSQSEVAKALGIAKYSTYIHWETRSPIPAYIMPAFAYLVGTDLTYLLTGEHDPP